jgi:hypothetical protein
LPEKMDGDRAERERVDELGDVARARGHEFRYARMKHSLVVVFGPVVRALAGAVQRSRTFCERFASRSKKKKNRL